MAGPGQRKELAIGRSPEPGGFENSASPDSDHSTAAFGHTGIAGQIELRASRKQADGSGRNVTI